MQTHHGHDHKVVIPTALPNQGDPHNRPRDDDDERQRRQRNGRYDERILALPVRLGHLSGWPKHFGVGYKCVSPKGALSSKRCLLDLGRSRCRTLSRVLRSTEGGITKGQGLGRPWINKSCLGAQVVSA